ncbi:acyltransferase family protein [Sphingobacterium corticibacterium]|uniref:Acyltransferase n=1 Tax=Sphingobacterium corticibacterium TaxID=2484746 RepID=A0A4Q6XNE8_9SPHI|nr:acyltransferase family protein [Sphingobacterium corticibacterium]RZF61683.1 acyltransferase [Sphingobacterium corticibacterium]
MEELDKRQSEVIDTLRFPLIILVVFGHMLGFENKPVAFDLSVENIYIFFSELISHGLARITVPAFFLFSGYFFFRKMKEWTFLFYFSQLKRRIWTLLIPYLIWNFLMIAAVLLKNYAFGLVGATPDEFMSSLQGNHWYFHFWESPINFPLWYLRELICMSLITPLFYFLFRYIKVYGLLLILCVYVLGWEVRLTGFSTWALWFFGAGAYIGFNKQNILYYTRPMRNLIYWIAIALLLSITFSVDTIYHGYLSRIFLIFGVMATINFIDGMTQKKITDFFVRMSGTVFFVYAIHEIYIINWLKGALERLAGGSWGIMLAGYFIVPFICLGICLGLYYVSKRIAPGLLAISVGGR